MVELNNICMNFYTWYIEPCGPPEPDPTGPPEGPPVPDPELGMPWKCYYWMILLNLLYIFNNK
jgi:hypothetical protein